MIVIQAVMLLGNSLSVYDLGEKLLVHHHYS
jgi:hypothetical protein